ncbi:unnamed protein product [Sphenostylis stenocarpa]|uniref:Bromo domain-containing protein n=1 Tax=Sphenostylis stenocarpa TaxID=92480 RepID=A0AA86VJA5_9FABA|nr:unnamed protein product [Sphenostylis stenocarpa]
MIDDASDKPSKLSSASFLPEKRILQLVLDILQRKDTYEIFSEPVDPNEVEDYYAIIKDPMDFGTMRAKLHERMYKTLEQFEHDVFLIFDNAMRFNSSGTIYFRQARVINELAKKVFDLLKNDPKKFEIEFSEPRKKIGRRNQGDFRYSTNLKSSEIIITVPSNQYLDTKDVEINVGEDDIGYKDSLMLFVKDLGPIAQKIAKRKYYGCEILPLQFPNHHPHDIRGLNGRKVIKGTLNDEEEKDCNPLMP